MTSYYQLQSAHNESPPKETGRDRAARSVGVKTADITQIENHVMFITLPLSAKQAQDPDGWTECLLGGAVKGRILSTSGFPQRLVYPPYLCYRIGPSQNGLGMFATRELTMGDHILTERPLIMIPTIHRMPEFAKLLEGLTPEERRQAIMDEWERKFLQPLFDRLDTSAQVAFMSLANSHTHDGSGPILGVIKTNSFEMSGVVTEDEDGEEGEYAAVCKIMSRINHSCSPSADRLFDIPSFSFQLRATRNIEEGEEIFISYCDVLETTTERQKYLGYFGFRCACISCLPDTTASDHRRLGLRQSIENIDKNLATWIANPMLSDDHVINISLFWISIVEEERLEASDAYRHHLRAIVDAYISLGDIVNAVRYGKMLGRWFLGQSGTDDMLQKMGDPAHMLKRPDWGVRNISQLIQSDKEPYSTYPPLQYPETT